MKRLGLLFVCIATLATVSCSTVSSFSDSNNVARTSGQTCGTALQGLYTSYRNTGKVDLTNASNLTNALVLATCYTQLNENKNNSDYRKSFTSGLIASSAGLITPANASSFVNTLLGATGLGGVTAENISKTATTATTIITLLNALNTQN